MICPDCGDKTIRAPSLLSFTIDASVFTLSIYGDLSICGSDFFKGVDIQDAELTALLESTKGVNARTSLELVGSFGSIAYFNQEAVVRVLEENTVPSGYLSLAVKAVKYLDNKYLLLRATKALENLAENLKPSPIQEIVGRELLRLNE
ncbi:MAG: hypothetical protein L3J47_00600 [Sulfurovum sp.]|nr:hypothetical protein [Sulfurovum sp.]